MSYLIGIDIGTSGTKSVLFDTDGNVIRSACVEYPMEQPQNGWAEQNPEDWWNAVCKTLTAITDGINTADISGIGLSGQMHGLVMLDDENNVIRPSIIWCDQRTAAECVEIEEAVGHDRLMEITASPALTGFTASKIMWVKKHEPENYAKCRHILLPKDYIRFMLTGVYATEVSDASGMQLMDIKNRCWSDEVLSALDIDRRLLGTMYESADITGYITDEASQLTGVAKGTAVVGGAGDNAAAAVGTGIVSEGKAFATIGTSGVVFAHTDKPHTDPQGRVHTFCCAVPGKWHVMGVTQAAGLSLKWYRENFAKNLSYKEMDVLASGSPCGANRLLYLPYLMGERTPHLDSNARGVFFGLSASHTQSDMLRSVMEGVTYSLRDCMEVLKEMGISPDTVTACGGGGTSTLWRQMLADTLALPIKTITSSEGPASGVAILAGVGTGIFASVEEACDKMIKEKDCTFPENTVSYEQYYKLYKKIYPSVKDLFVELSEL